MDQSYPFVLATMERILSNASTVQEKNESIVINNDVVITVVEIRGDKVRLGIVAPKDVPVHRQEVYDAIQGAERNTTTPSMVVTDNPEKRS